MLTLNVHEEQLLKKVLGHHGHVKGSLEFELNVLLFGTPRSACCGASTRIQGRGLTQHYVCTACGGACDQQ